MTDLQDLILHRRSIRKFKDRPLTFEEKRAILCSALTAPSSKNRRPCRLVLVEDREMINKLIRCKLIGTLPLETATWVLVVVADPTQSDAWIEDASVIYYNNNVLLIFYDVILDKHIAPFFLCLWVLLEKRPLISSRVMTGASPVRSLILGIFKILHNFKC